MNQEKILSYVDHTLLSPAARWDEIKQICDDGIAYKTASVCIPPCYVAQARDYVKGQVKICTVIGDFSEAEKYKKIRDDLNHCIHKNFWNAELSAYKSSLCFERDIPVYYTELANSLAVCAGVCPDEHLSKALETLASGRLLKITVSHARYKYDALMKEPDKWGNYIMDEIAEIWGNMLYQGATSFWETEKGAKDFSLSGSMCHGWSTIPIYIYFRYCLGIYPDSPGFKEYTIKPLIKGGYKFLGEFNTPFEKIILS